MAGVKVSANSITSPAKTVVGVASVVVWPPGALAAAVAVELSESICVRTAGVPATRVAVSVAVLPTVAPAQCFFSVSVVAGQSRSSTVIDALSKLVGFDM